MFLKEKFINPESGFEDFTSAEIIPPSKYLKK